MAAAIDDVECHAEDVTMRDTTRSLPEELRPSWRGTTTIRLVAGCMSPPGWQHGVIVAGCSRCWLGREPAGSAPLHRVGFKLRSNPIRSGVLTYHSSADRLPAEKIDYWSGRLISRSRSCRRVTPRDITPKSRLSLDRGLRGRSSIPMRKPSPASPWSKPQVAGAGARSRRRRPLRRRTSSNEGSRLTSSWVALRGMPPYPSRLSSPHQACPGTPNRGTSR